jgi:2-aminophenol/2-amino-5-chlorophenol 1,6-dioxygenase alpha subunit
MPVVSAFLAAGNPLPRLVPDNPPWAGLRRGYEAACRALAASRPDVLAVYSTQWIAVLDQLWQTRARSTGVHVDENWHEFGDLPFDIRADVELANAVIEATPAFGVRSKGVDYDAFPIDTGTIVANDFLNPAGLPLLIGSNNIYHDWETTARLGRAAVECADRLGRRVALVGVGGLSGTVFREEIDIANDRIASASDDEWNRRMLKLLERGDREGLRKICPEYAREARVDMGFKHLAFVLGGLDGNFDDAVVHAYGATWGAGAAVVEFKL